MQLRQSLTLKLSRVPTDHYELHRFPIHFTRVPGDHHYVMCEVKSNLNQVNKVLRVNNNRIT